MRVYSAAIGASYAPLQLLSPELLKGEKETSLAVPIAVFLACVATAAVLFIVGQVGVSKAKKENQDLKDRLEDTKYLEDLNNAYNESLATYASIREGLNAAKNTNRMLTQFISEMEAKMPQGFKTLQLVADETEGVTLNIVCASKSDAAKVFQQLRSFKTITIITSSGFKEEYGLRPEYDAILEEALKEEIDKAMEPYMEHVDALGYVMDDDGDLVPVESMREIIKERLLQDHKNQQIVLGRIKKEEKKNENPDDQGGEDGEDEHSLLDDIDAEDYFYINVFFSVNCLYNADNLNPGDATENPGTNDAFMEGAQKALEAEQKQRDKEAKNK